MCETNSISLESTYISLQEVLELAYEKSACTDDGKSQNAAPDPPKKNQSTKLEKG